MKWISPLTVGVACLAMGLLAGYSIPRREAPPTGEGQTNGAPWAAEPGKPAPRPPASASPKADHAFKFPKSAATPKQKAAATIAQSGPPATDDKARIEWLHTLPAADLPRLVTELCQSAGPNGLGNDERWLLSGAIDRWWREDGAGLLAWLKQLPSNRSKQYLVEKLLERISSQDPAQAAALAESFKSADPQWDSSPVFDSLLEKEVNQAWERPGITADEMLALYSRFSRGTRCQGTYLKTYPDGFDFRKFLDGMASLNRQDGKSPARMPPDILQAWAKADPQAAADWLLQHEATKRENGEVSFVEWDDIVNGITARSGAQAYLQWAAGVVTQGQGELRTVILRESNDQQLAGIIGVIPDAASRDVVLAAAIAASKNYGRDELGRIGLISTPEARLRIIAENADRFHSMIERGRNDPSLWPRIGLTSEQVAAALLKTDRQ